MLLLLLACAQPAAPPAGARGSFDAMATRVDVVVREPDSLQMAIALTRAACERVDWVANEWQSGSPLAEVNHAAGSGLPVPIPPDLSALLARSVELSRSTHGAFDPTWAALWGLWNLRANPLKIPDEASVESRRALVGVDGLTLGEGSAQLRDEGMALGLGAIAKGWALDRAADALIAAGIADFSLSAGGQVRVEGQSPAGGPWRVGLRAPRGGPDERFAVVSLGSGSVSTSGDYERFAELGGVRFSHILDPRSGWPAQGVQSATVIARDGTSADALSTAMFVLGPQDGIALAVELGVDAVIVDAAGELHLSPGVVGRLELGDGRE